MPDVERVADPELPSAAPAPPRSRRFRRAALLVGTLALTLLAIRVGVWAVQEKEARDATAHLAAVVQATPDGGRIDLATAFPAHWDRAAVGGGYAFGSDVNALLGVRAMGDDDWVTEDEKALVLADGYRIVAVINLWKQPSDIALPDDLDSVPGLSITRDGAAFIVKRTRGSAVLVPPPG